MPRRRIATLFSTLLIALHLSSPVLAIYPHEKEWIEILFVEDAQVRLRGAALVDEGAVAGLPGVESTLSPLAFREWHRISDVPERKLDELAANGAARIGRPLYNLNNVYRLRIPESADVVAVAAELEALPGVRLARPVPLPPPAPFPPPDYTSSQGYARAASSTPVGIDADLAWLYSGGDGSGVTICDLEYSWNYNHGDVTKLAGSQINTNVADPFIDTNHGTAVVGQLVGDSNAYGVTGLAKGANVLTCGTYYGATPQWNVPGALAVAVANLSAGDVILIEQQWDYTGASGFIPIEWWLDYSPNAQTANAVVAAIQNAVANGIHVVEAGGNGYYDTDTLSWTQTSGAVIVGAGGAYAGGPWPAGDLERLAFSSYGSRFHLQGWGENVVTTGYGDLYNADGIDYYYTNTFSGTSSASPIVASAIASCVGYWKAQGRTVASLPPSDLRSVLVQTGTPQVNPNTGLIGPRPDLAAAFEVLHTDWVEGPLGPISSANHSVGIEWIDYDGDGDHDLHLSNASSTPSASVNQLLRNDGDWNFVDATPAVLADGGYTGSTAWADYDNDGDPDAYLVNKIPGPSANRLVRNDGGGNFTDVTSGPLGIVGSVSDATWADYDGDQDLDLYVTIDINAASNLLFRNDGADTFVDVTTTILRGPGGSATARWADADDDGDPDLYLGTRKLFPNKLLRNDAGSFVDVTSGPLGDLEQTNGIAWGDMDNDGDLDLYLANTAFPNTNKLLRNDGAAAFVNITTPALADTTLFPKSGYGPTWADWDNDGDLDLHLSNGGHANRLYQNTGSGFVDATRDILRSVGANQTFGAGWADYDGDGDLDLYLASTNLNSIFRNDNTHGNHWLHIDLVGVTSPKDGTGARVYVTTTGGTQMREVGPGGSRQRESQTVEFGLCQQTLQSIVVKWPSGTVDSLTTSLPFDERVAWIEGSGPGAVSADLVSVGPTFRLHGNAPNPFGPQTTIRFDLPHDGLVNLRVFDVAGRLVRTLVQKPLTAGAGHRVRWDGRDAGGRRVASGVYFYRLDAGAVSASRKMVMLR